MIRNASVEAVMSQVKKAVVGKDGVLLRILISILARGHVLLEDIPGVGKTTIVLAFSKALGLSCRRVQFTPDVMPSDLTGFSVLDQQTQQLKYVPGALMCNLFLADELNRASSRTQSALLEAMEEGRVTVDGVTRAIPSPFLVIATQNPAGASGTQLLPDSQLDRFTLRLSVGYPTMADEAAMVRRRRGGAPPEEVEQAVSPSRLEEMQREVEQVYLSDEVLRYLLLLIQATRQEEGVRQGASPRGTLALTAASQAMAYIQGRDYVIPEDVSFMFQDAIAHRLVYAPGSAGNQAGGPLERILRSVAPPRLR